MEQVDDLGKITIVKNGKEVDCDINITDQKELEMVQKVLEKIAND